MALVRYPMARVRRPVAQMRYPIDYPMMCSPELCFSLGRRLPEALFIVSRLDSTNVVYEIAGSDNASPLSDSADAASDLFMNGAHRNGNSAMAAHRAVQKSK